MVQSTPRPSTLAGGEVTAHGLMIDDPSRMASDIDGLAQFLESLERLLANQGNGDRVIRPMADAALMKGLRVRPVLVYLGYNLLNETAVSNDAVVSLAAVWELIHKSSVILDDLVDGDEQRRGDPTFHSQHGPANTTIFAFWLVNQANQIMHGLVDSPHVKSHQSSVLLRYYDALSNDLTVGALHELAAKDSPTSVLECMRTIARQSATLICTCLASGFAMSDRVSPAVLEEVESLGRRIGMVYQVMNDLMAFTTAADKGRFASSEHWSDIVSNRKNLVVSIAYEGLSVEQRARWHECLASYHHDASTVETIVGMIESTNAVSQVVTWLSRHRSMVADRATGLPDTPARNLLIGALKSGNERSLFGGRTYRDLVDRLRLTYGPRTD